VEERKEREAELVARLQPYGIDLRPESESTKRYLSGQYHEGHLNMIVAEKFRYHVVHNHYDYSAERETRKRLSETKLMNKLMNKYLRKFRIPEPPNLHESL